MSNPRLHEIISRSLERRESLKNRETSLIRLIDGQGDNLNGHILEQYGKAWLISTNGSNLAGEVSDILTRYEKPLYWKRLDQHQKESPVHIYGEELPEFFTGLENGLKCRLSFKSGYSQGVFIDQRNNREALRKMVKPGQTVLNTFSYTGFFSIAAAAAGAITSSLDLSQVYLDWTRKNFLLNGIDPTDHYFCKGDTFHWLRRFAKQSRFFDYIILDPPTFSRDNKGKVFRAEKDYNQLFKLASTCLAPGGKILACTNFRGISVSDFMKQLKGADLEISPMPEDFTDTPYLKSIWATFR
ncbi:MAG: class I SAM-dependent methyltransferase [Akkermansiaceae bacterium]|jgi:23S rRNA (cytosine1962-C5)-methyltransferase|nr:class I SAM-dependent methyltransferase [Akkermansiaceae bacterium]